MRPVASRHSGCHGGRLAPLMYLPIHSFRPFFLAAPASAPPSLALPAASLHSPALLCLRVFVCDYVSSTVRGICKARDGDAAGREQAWRGNKGREAGRETVRSNMGKNRNGASAAKRAHQTSRLVFWGIASRVGKRGQENWGCGCKVMGSQHSAADREQGDGIVQGWAGARARLQAQNRGWSAAEGSATQEASAVGGGLRERVGRG